MSSQNQKLSQMVLKKMKQKKQAQQRNRPHFQLLQLQIKFSIEENQQIKEQIKTYNQKLKSQTQKLNELKLHLQELQNTGKQKYPVIVLKPDFIASENISMQMKNFYRKAANTFLKADIIKTQKHQVYLQKQHQIVKFVEKINQIQANQDELIIKNNKIFQKKRANILKEDLKRRKLIEEQQSTQNKIERLRNENEGLLREYAIKKQNLSSRIAHNQNLFEKIQQQKIKIQQKYNPVTYRDYLKKIFDIRIKNQYMEKNLNDVIVNMNNIKKNQDDYRKQLESKCKTLTFYGKVSNSPSKFKGKIQKQFEKQQLKRCQTNPKNLTELIQNSSGKKSVSVAKSQRSLPNKVMGKIKNHNNLQDDKFLSKKHGSHYHDHQNYNSLKTLKNSIKSERTMSTTFRTISTTKKAINFD